MRDRDPRDGDINSPLLYERQPHIVIKNEDGRYTTATADELTQRKIPVFTSGERRDGTTYQYFKDRDDCQWIECFELRDGEKIPVRIVELL